MPAFCPNCKSMLFPKGGVLECNKCGYKGGKSQSNVLVTAREDHDILILDEADRAKLEVMPTMRIECPKCGNWEAWFRTQQTRKSDEPETVFLRCTKCDNRWRRY